LRRLLPPRLEVEGRQDRGARFELLNDVISLPVGIRLATLL
jgi:hypothetical protein